MTFSNSPAFRRLLYQLCLVGLVLDRPAMRRFGFLQIPTSAKISALDRGHV